jgi:hypothetical protein
MTLTPADMIWNRAAMDEGGQNPASGDRALAALLKAHSLAMNGGVMHAVEILDELSIADAKTGYRFFGFEGIPNLLSRAKELLETNFDLGIYEQQFDKEYYDNIPDDDTIVKRFEQHLANNPTDFSPLQ